MSAESGHRTQLDLMTAQLEAIDAWNAARRAADAASDAAGMTRELRLDASRRLEAREREQRAIIARADAQLRVSGDVLTSRPAVRAVLAHRNAWLCARVVDRLQSHGVTVVGVYQDGADAAGTIVVEQPELVLVEDRLPTLPGVELVRRVRDYSRHTLVGAHVLDSGAVDGFVAAGARAVFTRRIPPLEIADRLLGCLDGDGRPLTMV